MANIFDLSVEEFQAVLPELQAQGVDVAPLMREYRRLNSALAPVYGLIDRVRGTDTEAGRTRATLLPMTSPEGMSGLEAIRSGQAELAVPGGLIGMLEGGAMAADAPAAASAGLMPVEDAPMEAMGVAGAAMLGGGAMPAPSGALRAMAMRSVDEYGGTHRAPRRSNEYGASLDDPRDMFGGDDIYSSNAMRYFGHGDPAMDGQSIRAINTARSNPDAEIIVYRAVPKDLENAQINAGDWVTPSKLYAERHGEGPLSGNYQIIEQKVRAGDLFSDGDIHEWGYDPLTTSANRDAATGAVVSSDGFLGRLIRADEIPARTDSQKMAKRILQLREQGRASEVTKEMMEEADPDFMALYTPLDMSESARMSRARELGFEDQTYYHGAKDTPELPYFDSIEEYNTEGHMGTIYGTSNPAVANTYVRRSYDDEGAIYPLMVRRDANDPTINVDGVYSRIPMSIKDETGRPLMDILPDAAGMDHLNAEMVTNTDAIADAMRGADFSMLRMENVIDRGPYYPDATPLGFEARSYRDIEKQNDFSKWNREMLAQANQPATNVMVQDATKLRSRFARFDPEFSHLANLSAANASPGVGLLQMYQQQQLEDRARRRGLLP